MVITALNRELRNRFTNIEEEQIDEICNAVNFLIDRVVIEEDDVFNGIDMDIIHKFKNYMLERNVNIFNELYKVIKKEADWCIMSKFTLITEYVSPQNMNKPVLELHELYSTDIYKANSLSDAIAAAKNRFKQQMERGCEGLVRFTIYNNENGVVINDDEVKKEISYNFEVECKVWTSNYNGGIAERNVSKRQFVTIKEAMMHYESMVNLCVHNEKYNGWDTSANDVGLKDNEKECKFITHLNEGLDKRVTYIIRVSEITD